MEITCGIFVVDNKNHLLICHPTDDPPNKWSIPKGWPEHNETFEDAALRELEEETGLRLKDYEGKLEFVGEIPYQNKPKKLIAFSFFLTVEIKQPLICKGLVSGTNIPEMDIIKWLDVKDALHTIQPEQAELLKKLLQEKQIV